MWARHRQALILTIIGAVIVAIIAITLIATLYKAPSCSDNKQNQGETGIDCGGPCPYLCTADVTPPQVRFVRPLSPTPGRTDVIAYIDNVNATAAEKGAAYTITLYGPDNVVLAQKSGTVDLPPESTVPVFMPDFASGAQTAAQAFLNFATSSIRWYSDTAAPLVLPVSGITLTNGAAPRLSATVVNPLATPLYRVPVVATVFDASNNAIAASATVLDIAPQGSAPAIFTWNAPFSGAPAREDVIPLPPL